jgi:hypothetical protein
MLNEYQPSGLQRCAPGDSSFGAGSIATAWAIMQVVR